MSKSSAHPHVWTMAFVVTGNLIGAGILGLPINTGLTGLIPALIGNVVMWLLMLTTAIILSEQKSLTETENADLPTFFQAELGSVGKWITVIANMIILYGLLVAYLSGAGSILHSLFKGGSGDVFMLLFFAIATTLTLFGMSVLRKGNALLMFVLWVTFVFLVFMVGDRMDANQVGFTDWKFLPAALPILVTAFHFHNLIPSLCRSLDFDKKAIRKAMFTGTAIGLVMNVIWTVVVIGALPLNGEGKATIFYAFKHNEPATIPLSQLIQSPMFSICALLFALLAITTSYMANGTALKSFIRDLTSTHLGISNKWLVAVLAFLPPLAITVLFPNLFLQALNIVGGVGINTIFGILPGILLIKKGGRARLGGYLLLAAFSFVMLFELGQEFNLIDLHPAAEYWNYPLKHP
jgi:tyrosine-specific transport protein